MVMVLANLGTQVSARANDLPVDPEAEVEADLVLTDDPLIPDTVDLPPEFQVAGTTSFAYGADGSRTYFGAPSASASANWDSICGNGKSRYSVVADYTRSGKHSRFERSYARMYCGKKDRTSATPHSEAAFGLRHVRAYHRSQIRKARQLARPLVGNVGELGDREHTPVTCVADRPEFDTLLL